MPNLKIHVEEIVWAKQADHLVAALPSLRETLCRELKVDVPLCHLTVIPVRGLSDQTPISIEIQMLPKPDRTRDLILSVCGQLRDTVAEATSEKAAVRVVTLDPATYVTLR